MIAKLRIREHGITVWGSLQCPYYVHKALMALCNLPGDKVRVVQMETGGAFGGKEEYPSMIAAHAVLLAIKSRRPVKIVYDRMEDMAATTKRHPSRTRHRTAVSKDGKILGGEIEFVIDVRKLPNAVAGEILSRGTVSACRSHPGPAVLSDRESPGYMNAPPLWGVPADLRRAAESVCAGTAHGSHRAGGRDFSG